MEVSSQLQTPAALPPSKEFLPNPLYMKMGGFQSRSGYCGEEKILFHLPGFEFRLLGGRVRNLFAIMSELSRILSN
jgi:hypothetical protein